MTDRCAKRTLERCADEVAYDNPGMEWGADTLRRIAEHHSLVTLRETPLTREEIEVARRAFEKRQQEIAHP